MSISGKDSLEVVNDCLNSELITQLARQLYSHQPASAPVEPLLYDQNPALAAAASYAFFNPADLPENETLCDGAHTATTDAATHYYFFPYSAKPLFRPPYQAKFNATAVRSDFPALNQTINGQPLVWLDNAATAQKPQCVIDTVANFYSHDNSNVHRGAHTLAKRATEAYEQAREKLQKFLGADSSEEIIFTRGTTEAINLVAQSLGRQITAAGDEIILSTLEHHSNIVPWQLLCQEKGASLKVIPINDRGEIILEEFARLLNTKTRLVALTHVSNALGSIIPVKTMIDMAHQKNIPVLIDGAQSTPHLKVDVKQLDADFYALSGHKLFGPTGIGVLYGKKKLLEAMPPWQSGGNMIDKVTFDHTTFNSLPNKFEAGTGHIAGAVGLGAAVDYLNAIGLDEIENYETELLAYAMKELDKVPRLRQIGAAADKAGILSFTVPGVSPQQVASLLDQAAIAVRAGHHCAQPALARFGLDSTVRASLAFYNTFDDIDKLIFALRKIANY